MLNSMTNTDIILKLNKLKGIPEVEKLLPYCEELLKKPNRPTLKKLTRELESFSRRVQKDKNFNWYSRSRGLSADVTAEELMREFKNRMVTKMKD